MDELSQKELEKIKFQEEVVESSSLLADIRMKEIELNAGVLEAKKEAEKILAEARSQAAALHEKAAEEGQKEGQAIFSTELEKAKAEAEKIRLESKAEIDKVKDSVGEHFDKALELVLNVVLP